MFDIEEELKKLPPKPGVYIMHDERDTIIYVGKAISLRNRVRSYFRASTNKTFKIETMVSKISRFEYIITDSELEALVLENNLIKEHRPRYNTMLKDDKTYPYIKITNAEEYPRVLFSREMRKDKSKYYGPYQSAGAVKDSIEMVRKLYKIRTCNRNLPKDIGKDRPCLNYHIKQCNAPCQGLVSKEAYGESIKRVMDFLGGEYNIIIKDLEQKMQEASEEMRFEEAIEYRELLISIKKVAQRQKITHADGEDKDIIAAARDEKEAVVQVFFIRNGKLIGREHFYMTQVSEKENKEIIQSFIKQFYAGTPLIPRELMIQEEIEEQGIIEEWLGEKRKGRVRITVPKKGKKEKLVELAERNAAMILSQDREKMKREEGRTIGAQKEVAELLQLSGLYRIEAFDISNISGFESVGSMIVYEKGRPKRSDYRKFKIKSVQGPDDYASMEEVLSRRFQHGIDEKAALAAKGNEEAFGSFVKFPDLIMMDGGKGQVNIALKVLNNLNLNIPVCGMVKDDNHRTRGLYYNNTEIPIDKHSEAFKLITRIQDEAHRFAIEYHRSLRKKGQVHSVLDDIPGIGPSRRKALMRHFKSLEEIKNASEEVLCAVPSMNASAAQKVYDYFHTQG